MHNTGVLEDLMEVIENKYLAANIVSKRARWLNEKRISPTIKTDALKKTTMALEELLADKLDYKPVQSEEHREIDELAPLEPSKSGEEDSEPLFDEEYVDDRNMIFEDEEPEEGI